MSGRNRPRSTSTGFRKSTSDRGTTRRREHDGVGAPLLDELQAHHRLTLLDGVRRRSGRGFVRDEEIGRIERRIRARFPDAEL